MRLPPRFERLAARNPFPPGSVTVGVWLGLNGLVTYGFLAVAARSVSADRYSALSALWALAFLAGPGCFLPLEQEVSRSLAARRARGVGSGPLVRRAALLGAGFAGVLVIACAALSGLLVNGLFDGQVALLFALMLVLVGYGFEHLTRGVLAGNELFGRYGFLLGGEGLLRLAGALVLAAIGVATVGPYGIVVGLAPYAASGLALFGQHGLTGPGPPAPWRELSSSLGYLLAGSILAQTLVNAAPLATQALAGPAQGSAAGRLLNGLVVARVPLFLFQAVQAALLPNLSGLHGAGRDAEFRRGLRRLMGAVVAIGTAATIGAAVIGPWVVRVLFGDKYVLTHRDMFFLALGSAVFMAALALAQALLALGGQKRAALGWLAGVIAFGLALLIPNPLLLRVEIAYLAGTAVATLCVAAVLAKPLRMAGSAPKSDIFPPGGVPLVIEPTEL
ncbi:MAG TPA: hypothetical protein VF441_08020 [Acidimicrobiia bacterium]